jgi:hypothetical protein
LLPLRPLLLWWLLLILVLRRLPLRLLLWLRLLRPLLPALPGLRVWINLLLVLMLLLHLRRRLRVSHRPILRRMRGLLHRAPLLHRWQQSIHEIRDLRRVSFHHLC